MGLSVPIQSREICERLGKARVSKGRAKSEAKRLTSRSGHLIEAFKCPDCGGWHVGKRAQRPGAFRR